MKIHYNMANYNIICMYKQYFKITTVVLYDISRERMLNTQK